VLLQAYVSLLLLVSLSHSMQKVFFVRKHVHPVIKIKCALYDTDSEPIISLLLRRS